MKKTILTAFCCILGLSLKTPIYAQGAQLNPYPYGLPSCACDSGGNQSYCQENSNSTCQSSCDCTYGRSCVNGVCSGTPQWQACVDLDICKNRAGQSYVPCVEQDDSKCNPWDPVLCQCNVGRYCGGGYCQYIQTSGAKAAKAPETVKTPKTVKKNKK